MNLGQTQNFKHSLNGRLLHARTSSKTSSVTLLINSALAETP